MTAATQTQTAGAPTPENNDQIVQTLTASMTAAEIRAWMSEEGIPRPRGARKAESVERALEVAPELTAEKAASFEAPAFRVTCSCGVDQTHDDFDDAYEAARSHKSQHNTHWPKAVDVANDERIYG